MSVTAVVQRSQERALEILRRTGKPFPNYFARNTDDEVCARPSRADVQPPGSSVDALGLTCVDLGRGARERVWVFEPALEGVAIPGWTDEELFVAVAAHELGHAMGLVHHAGPYLMNPTIGGSKLPAPDDVAQWRDLHR